MTLFVGPLDVDWTEDDEGAIDMDKSIAKESTRGCLDKKKTFLVNFLSRKLVKIGNGRTAVRNFNLDKSQKENTPSQERGRTVWSPGSRQASKHINPRWGGVTGVYTITQTLGQLSFIESNPWVPNRTPTWGQVNYIRTPSIFTNSGCNTTPTWWSDELLYSKIFG